MTDVRLTFADFVVDVPARAVLRNGKPLSFEPKVFDALVYLIEHRGRVVPKHELLESVWGRRVVVTEGVIARTIMKLRRLLGDDADEPALIKTVHRVGYRFASEVTREATAMTGPGRGSASSRRRVAVLPFVNRTGSDALSWVDVGLMAVTCQALENVGVAVVAAVEMLATVGTAADGVALASALATDVVEATLSMRADGALVLTWLGHGGTLDALHGELSGDEPIQLCRRLASQLRLRLAPDREPAPAVHDPYVQAVRARAAAAIAGERWESARRLLQVALDDSPDDSALQFDLAVCLVQLRDARAQALLERLQRSATATGDSALERRCLRLQARCKSSEGDDAGAERLLSRALSLAEAAHDREAELHLLQAMAELAADRGRGAIADWLLDRAAALAQVLGDGTAIARVLDTRGRLAAAAGDRDVAIRHFEDALQMQRAAGIHAGAAHTLTHLGTAHHAYGQICIARQCFAAAFEKALKSGDPAAIAIAGMNAGRFCGTEIGRDDFAVETVARMRAIESPGRIVIDTFADLLDAVVEARAGRLAECLELLDRGEAGYPRRNFRLRIRRFRTVVLAASGFIDESRDTMREFHEDVPSGLRAQIASIGQHMSCICDHVAGDSQRALHHAEAAVASAPHSLFRLEMAFDAAWLALECGDCAAAARTVDAWRAELNAALDDEHAPALVLRAKQLEAAGDTGASRALLRRCPLPPGAVYGWNDVPSNARYLPSIVSIAASLHGVRQARRAAA